MTSKIHFEGNRQFATTRWSTVKALNNDNRVAAKSALEELCQTYWYPLYTYVRRQGNDADAAADLTQAFFTDLLQREDLRKVDPSLGKFRSFLLTAMKHFLLNEWDKARAQKRGGGRSLLSLDFGEADNRFRREPSHGDTPEVAYQRQWVKSLLDRVTDELRSEFAERGKAHQFDRLQKFLGGKNREETLAEAASQLSMSEVAVKVAVHRMRQRFGDLLRADIANTVSTPEEVDSEIRELFSVLGD
ncbi:MAG: sigma-70 family RNA polymerase sigma factor [Planctomycetota bacterium]